MAFEIPKRKYQSDLVSRGTATGRLLEVTGDKELIRKLNGLKDSGIRRVMVAAMRSAGRESAKVLKQNATHKAIKREIGWSATRLSSHGRANVKAGVSVGRRPLKMFHRDKARLAELQGNANLTKAQVRHSKKLTRLQSRGLSAYSAPAVVFLVLGTARRYTRTGAHRGKMIKRFSAVSVFMPQRRRIMDASAVVARRQLEKEIVRGRP